MNGCYVDFVRVVARVLFIQHWQAEESRAFRANPSRGNVRIAGQCENPNQHISRA